MAITYNEEKRIFTLETRNTTYQMQEGPYGFLLHLYYGKKLGCGDADYLIRRADISFAGNPPDAGADRTFSLDVLPQEFTSYGVGDYRDHAVGVVGRDGSRAADFRVVSWEVKRGAYQIPGMPALYECGDESETLEIRLEDRCAGLGLTLYYGVWEREDIITRAAGLTNLEDGAVTVEKLMSASLDLPYGKWELIHFHGRHAMERQLERVELMHGVMSVGSRRGTSSHQHNPAVLLCGRETGEDYGSCYGMSLVYSGNFSAEVELDQLSQVRAMIGINPEYFSFRLEKGEELFTPQVLLTYTDRGFHQLSRNYHRIMRDNLCRGKYKTARRPVLINSWEAAYFDFDDRKLLDIAKKAFELGLEMLVLDDGWFGKRDDDNSGLGDWTVNTQKLPGGLGALVEKVNGLGLKFGIWVEPEMVSEDSDLYRAHPDWALQMPGRKPCRGRYQLVLDMSRQEVRDYLFNSLSKVLKSANIEYVKWDMNRSICDVYSALLPKERQGEVYHRYVLGVYELLERLIAAFPDILLEGCSGGGGRFDPAMLYYSPQIWCSDDTDAVERLEIQYGTSFIYPISAVGSHVSASPNHQTGRRTPFHTRAVVAMAGSFGYEMDLNLLSDEEKEEVKSQVAAYKKYYELIHRGDYYRLTEPEGTDFTAWQFVSGDRGKSLVNLVVTHVRANYLCLHIYLKGLDPEKMYRLEGRDQVLSGSALMYAGLTLPAMGGDYPACQIYLEEE